MSRAAWFVAGAGAGVYAMVKARRTAEVLTPEGLADRLAGLSVGARLSATRSAPGCRRRKPSCATAWVSRSMELPTTRSRVVSTGSTSRESPTTGTTRERATTDGHRGGPPTVHRALRGARTPGGAVGIVAAGRPEPALRQRGHGAVQALLPRPGDAGVQAGRLGAEVRAHARHRGGRQDHPARHVLPDERQLLVRRLLQGRRDRARVGAGHPLGRRRRLRDRRVEALRQRLPGRRRGRHLLEEGGGSSRRPDHPAGQEGQLLEHGRPGPWRSVQRDPDRPRPRVRRRP